MILATIAGCCIETCRQPMERAIARGKFFVSLKAERTVGGRQVAFYSNVFRVILGLRIRYKRWAPSHEHYLRFIVYRAIAVRYRDESDA